MREIILRLYYGEPMASILKHGVYTTTRFDHVGVRETILGSGYNQKDPPPYTKTSKCTVYSIVRSQGNQHSRGEQIVLRIKLSLDNSSGINCLASAPS